MFTKRENIDTLNMMCIENEILSTYKIHNLRHNINTNQAAPVAQWIEHPPPKVIIYS